MSNLPALHVGGGRENAVWQDLGALVAGLGSYPQSASSPYADVPAPSWPREPVLAEEQRDDAGQVLVRLFSGHAAVPTPRAERALSSVDVDALVRSGFVSRDRQHVIARFQIQRWGDLLVACDWPEHHEEGEYVHGVTNAGRTLAFLTPRWTIDRALDLGAGCGLQAVLAARHAREVVASDVNVRAVALATVTAGLNNAANVDLRVGSWFEPVIDETFDLIVANPPYVISPEHRLVYRDAGDGDELCGWLLSGLPARLNNDGFAVMLVNWARRAGETWSDTPGRWLKGLDAFSVAIKFAELSTRDYACRFNAPLADEPERFVAAVDAWLDYYARLGIDALELGAVAMTARPAGRPARGDDSGPRWWAIAAAHEASGPGGAQLTRLVQGTVRAATMTIADARRAVARLAPGHELWQRLRFVDGAHVADNIHMVFPNGLGVEAEIEPEALAFVLAIDGVRDVQTLVGELHDAEALSPDVSVDEASRLVLELARAGCIELHVAGSDGNPT